MRTPTDYTKQKNRCPNCGHRLTLATHSKALTTTVVRCAQVSGKPSDPTLFIPCPCREHVRLKNVG